LLINSKLDHIKNKNIVGRVTIDCNQCKKEKSKKQTNKQTNNNNKKNKYVLEEIVFCRLFKPKEQFTFTTIFLRTPTMYIFFNSEVVA